MTFSTSTRLYIHHHCLVPEHFLSLKGNLVPIKETLPIPPSTQPPATINLLSVCGFADSGYFIKNEMTQDLSFCVWLLSFGSLF